MNSKYRRLETFENVWRYSHIVSPENLSRAGFFYLGFDDYVQCSFCKIVLHDWKSNDKPLRKHITARPKCPFVLGRDGTNSPKMPRSKRNQGTQTDLDHPKIKTLIHSVHRGTQTVPLCPKLRHPKMKELTLRLKTYDQWPRPEISTEELAESGFFYSGISDVVTCYACAQTVGCWEPQDSALKDHENFSPDCVHVNIMKSRVFESTSCTLCVIRNREMLFVKCGHVVCCEQCAAKITECPICREFISKTVRVYLL